MSKFDSISEMFAKEMKGEDSDVDNIIPSVYLDTGIPQLNSILTGDPAKGLPSGQVTEIFGESGSGKTMLASRIMISAQQKDGFAMFYDFERAYHLALSVKQGLDPSRNKFFYRKAQCMEEALEDSVQRCRLIRNSGILPDTAPIVVIFDSFAGMVPKSMMFGGDKKAKGIDDYTMNDQTSLARAASLVLKPFTIEMNDLNVCAVFLNQVAASMEMHGPTTKTKGGKSLPFYASTRIGIDGKDLWSSGSVKTRIGKEMTFTTFKNRIRRPFEKTQCDFIYQSDGSGSWDIMPKYLAYLKNINVIKSRGAWTDFEGKSYNGISKLIEELEADPTAIERLVEAQLEFIALGNEVVELVDTSLVPEEESEVTGE